MKKKKTTPKDAEARANAYVVEEQKLLEKHQLAKRNVILFPRYKKTPFLGRLSIWILQKLGAKVDAMFIEAKK